MVTDVELVTLTERLRAIWSAWTKSLIWEGKKATLKYMLFAVVLSVIYNNSYVYSGKKVNVQTLNFPLQNSGTPRRAQKFKQLIAAKKAYASQIPEKEANQ